MIDVVVLLEREKRKAIRELVLNSPHLLAAIPDPGLFLRAVWRRERIGSTGIGHGVGVANGSLRSLTRVAVAVGVSREGIDYDSLDGRPVHLLYVIASGPLVRIEYLKVLQKVLAFARQEEMRSLLDDFRDDAYPLFLSRVKKEFSV